MPLPKKKLTLLTDDVLAAMTPTKHGGGYLTDEQVPLLEAWRTLDKPDNIKWVCTYYKRRLVINGFSRTREQIGLWPDMSIEQAREAARYRMDLLEEQAKNPPPTAPPMKNRFPKGGRPKRNKRLEREKKAVEELLANAPVLTDEERDRYEQLMLVLMDAHDRAAKGKGAERHDTGADFENQPSAIIMDQVGDGFAVGQALKKLSESMKLPWERARKERLDAIVYVAASIIWKDGGGKV